MVEKLEAKKAKNQSEKDKKAKKKSKKEIREEKLKEMYGDVSVWFQQDFQLIMFTVREKMNFVWSEPFEHFEHLNLST